MQCPSIRAGLREMMNMREAYKAALWNEWHPVATVQEIDDVQNPARRHALGYLKPVAKRLLDERLVLWRLPSGKIACLHGTCQHRSAGLEVGFISEDGRLATCLYHDWGWSGETGRIASIPHLEEEGRPLPVGDPEVDQWKTMSFETVVSGGLVWTHLGDSPRWPVLEIPFQDGAGFHLTPPWIEHTAAGVGRWGEAGNDLAHLSSSIHIPSGLAHPNSHRVPPVSVVFDQDQPYQMSVEFSIDQPDNITTVGRRQVGNGVHKVRYETRANPTAGYALKTADLRPDLDLLHQYLLIIAYSPVSVWPVLETDVYFGEGRTFDLDDPTFDLEVIAWNQRVLREDRDVILTMIPEHLATDVTAHELLTKHDRTTRTYRQMLFKAGIPFL